MKIKKMFLKSLWILILLFAFGGTPAFAADCVTEIEKIESALTSQSISQNVMAQVLSLRNEAVRLCNEGKTTEAMVPINEAKALLGIQ